MYRLRTTEEAWFSAAEFIKELTKANCNDDLVEIKDDYLRNRELYDPAGKPPSPQALQAKEKQIASAFEKLIDSKHILQKLKAINVVDARKDVN
ncbi:MAG: hypothetical protein REH83_04675, partial [Rickettsiella sp.]|nr:hypothetical protein [Rickettsiella sp.]